LEQPKTDPVPEVQYSIPPPVEEEKKGAKPTMSKEVKAYVPKGKRDETVKEVPSPVPAPAVEVKVPEKTEETKLKPGARVFNPKNKAASTTETKAPAPAPVAEAPKTQESPKVEELLKGKTSFSLKDMAEIRKRVKALTIDWKPKVKAGYFERRRYDDFPISRFGGKDDRKDFGNNNRRDKKGGHNNNRDRDDRRDGNRDGNRGDRNNRNDRDRDHGHQNSKPYTSNNSNNTGGGRANENAGDLKKQSKKMEVRMAIADQESIDKRAKLALNKITDENFRKIKPQILQIY
jgi:hypothetical protein